MRIYKSSPTDCPFLVTILKEINIFIQIDNAKAGNKGLKINIEKTKLMSNLAFDEAIKFIA